jgi:hypothetical protein
MQMELINPMVKHDASKLSDKPVIFAVTLPSFSPPGMGKHFVIMETGYVN